MKLKGVAIASHPPVLIPEVGQGKEKEAAQTLQGMRELMQKIVSLKPKTIVCITPHGNVFRDGVSVIYENRLSGSLKAFGHGQIEIEKKCDMALLDELNESFAKNQAHSIFLNQKAATDYNLDLEMDHGILVPLYFLEQYYQDYQIVHISIGHLSLIELYKTGSYIRQAIEKNNKDTIILASADLSHCLKDEGPYVFNQMGPVFDENIITGLKTKNYYSILTIPHQVYEPAGQCGLRPIVMSLGALDGYQTTSEVYSYEGPFGVGYLSAFIDLKDQQDESLIKRYEKDQQIVYKERRSAESPYVALARATINTWVQRGRKLNFDQYSSQVAVEKEALTDLRTKQAGVFVSLHKQGELRGCIGTTSAVTDNIAEEIIRNAIEAASYDPRFMPVEEEELVDLEIKVDVLEAAQAIDSIKDLDVKKYGVIVEKDLNRGLLLPDLEGIETVEDQVAIARQKAQIPKEATDVKLYRFKVTRHQ